MPLDDYLADEVHAFANALEESSGVRLHLVDRCRFGDGVVSPRYRTLAE
ncbi:hypothetical protein RCH23_001733 [Cryobacterium sp. CAN_C3]|nr:hypothetical protein [Cryobacterium sp. CAN_C3]MEC5154353.1 hypothetical protein [Cryobacterium sp. CAN_C3]